MSTGYRDGEASDGDGEEDGEEEAHEDVQHDAEEDRSTKMRAEPEED